MPRGIFAMLAGAALTVACDNSGGSSTTTATALPLTVETFSGSVDPQGSAFHTFTVAQTGEVDVGLTSVGPPVTIFMGLGIGAPAADGTCTLIAGASVSTQASTAPQLVGTASPGALCVKIFDIGNQTATVTYTVMVAHP